MEICKVSTLQLKALNKHSITHNVHRDVNVTAIKFFIEKLTQCRQGFKRNYAKDAHTHTH